MRRRHIYVVHAGDRWDVRLEGRTVAQRFGRKSHAVLAATQAAEQIWREDGVPPRVRVQLGSGRWEDARGFGELPLAAAG